MKSIDSSQRYIAIDEHIKVYWCWEHVYAAIVNGIGFTWKLNNVNGIHYHNHMASICILLAYNKTFK